MFTYLVTAVFSLAFGTLVGISVGFNSYVMLALHALIVIRIFMLAPRFFGTAKLPSRADHIWLTTCACIVIGTFAGTPFLS